jgi:hypothetical protein
MKPLQRWIRIVVGSFILMASCVGWAQVPGYAVITKTSKSGKLSVKLSFPKPICPLTTHWLNEQRGRQDCIEAILIARNGVEAYFPDFSYNFLASPTSIEIKEKGKGYILTLAGGDASSAYVAVFMFERDSLKRRRISSAAFPAQAWEDSTFTFNLSDK